MGHGTSLVRLKIGNNCTSIPFIVVVKEGRLFLKSVPCTRDLSSFSMSYFEYRAKQVVRMLQARSERSGRQQHE